MEQTRVGIIRLTGQVLARELNLPGHKVIDLRRDFGGEFIDLLVSGPLMPRQQPHTEPLRAEVMPGEIVRDTVDAVWHHIENEDNE